MYCNQCGEKLSPEARFCPKCGHPVRRENFEAGVIPPDAQQKKDSDRNKKIAAGAAAGTAAIGASLLRDKAREADPAVIKQGSLNPAEGRGMRGDAASVRAKKLPKEGIRLHKIADTDTASARAAGSGRTPKSGIELHRRPQKPAVENIARTAQTAGGFHAQTGTAQADGGFHAQTGTAQAAGGSGTTAKAGTAGTATGAVLKTGGTAAAGTGAIKTAAVIAAVVIAATAAGGAVYQAASREPDTETLAVASSSAEGYLHFESEEEQEADTETAAETTSASEAVASASAQDDAEAEAQAAEEAARAAMLSETYQSYLDLVTSHADAINAYTYQNGYSSSNPGTVYPAALQDINGDGIPELFCMEMSGTYTAELHIYTYADGAVTEVSYPYEEKSYKSSRLVDDNFPGAKNYVVYLGQDGQLYIYKAFGDEYREDNMQVFQMTSPSSMEKTSEIVSHENMFSESNSYYRLNGVDTSKDAAQQSLNQAYGQMGTPILQAINGRSQGNRYDWYNMDDCIAMTYDEIVAYLQGGYAESSAAGAGAENGTNGNAAAGTEGQEASGEAASASAIRDLYNQTIDQSGATSYALYDIDKDGRPELILEVGSNSPYGKYSVSVYDIYTCVQDGSGWSMQQVAANISQSLYQTDGNGIYLGDMTSMGWESYYLYTLQEGVLSNSGETFEAGVGTPEDADFNNNHPSINKIASSDRSALDSLQ